MRPWLLDQSELSIDDGAPAARDGDRQSGHSSQRAWCVKSRWGRTDARRASSSSTSTTGKKCAPRRRIIVLAASACETVRILLNSKSAQFPQGLANSSGKVGKYLMDTVGASVTGQIPLLENMPAAQ